MELGIVISFLVIGLYLELRYRVVLFHTLKERLLIIGIVFIILMGWEIINFRYFQTWLYPGPGMIGIYILGLPLELYLFFITAPYFSFIVYELIQKEIDIR